MCLPTDFVVLEMEEAPCFLVILERPFLTTARVFIDVKNHKLSLVVGEKRIQFELSEATDHVPFENECHKLEGTQTKRLSPKEMLIPKHKNNYNREKKYVILERVKMRRRDIEENSGGGELNSLKTKVPN